MIVLGLTGSIAMGKSTTAKMFREAGVPVWDADAAVHEAYAPGGAAVGPVGEVVPEAVVAGGVDRATLREAIAMRPQLLSQIESRVHPLVAEDRRQFLAAMEDQGQPVVVVDIPLLFETQAQDQVDRIVVVTAPPGVQRGRVLARPGMTAERFDALLTRQVPDAEKRAQADYIIDTSQGLEAAQCQVAAILAELGTGNA